jgi:hypothetical protein
MDFGEFFTQNDEYKPKNEEKPYLPIGKKNRGFWEDINGYWRLKVTSKGITE